MGLTILGSTCHQTGHKKAFNKGFGSSCLIIILFEVDNSEQSKQWNNLQLNLTLFSSYIILIIGKKTKQGKRLTAMKKQFISLRI